MLRWDVCAGETRSSLERLARWLLAAAVLAGATWPVPAAAASEGAVPLEWFAPAACPSRDDVLVSLASLQHVDASSWQRFERVRGNVTILSAGFRLELEFVGGNGAVGRRDFVTRNCADLALAAAAALALALEPGWDGWTAPLDPEAASTPSEHAPAAAAASNDGRGAGIALGGVSPVGDQLVVDATRAEHGATPLSLVLGVEGLFDPVSLGSPAFGAGAAARLRTAAWAAELYAVWLPEASIDIGADIGVDLELLAGGARGCHSSGAHLALCVELEAGRLGARGWGYSAARSASDPWITPGVSVELSSPVAAAVALRSRISLMVPVIRPDYFVNDSEKVHDVPAVVLRFALGATLPLF